MNDFSLITFWWMLLPVKSAAYIRTKSFINSVSMFTIQSTGQNCIVCTSSNCFASWSALTLLGGCKTQKCIQCNDCTNMWTHLVPTMIFSSSSSWEPFQALTEFMSWNKNTMTSRYSTNGDYLQRFKPRIQFHSKNITNLTTRNFFKMNIEHLGYLSSTVQAKKDYFSQINIYSHKKLITRQLRRESI